MKIGENWRKLTKNQGKKCWKMDEKLTEIKKQIISVKIRLKWVKSVDN